MNRFKITLLAFVLGFVLVAGQPHAIMAASQTSPNPGISLNSFDSSTSDYGVSIDSVGPDALNTFDLDADGTYHVVSDSSFNLVRVTATISGFNVDGYTHFIGNSTEYNTTVISNGTDGEAGTDDDVINGTKLGTGFNTTTDLPYAGELYQVVNGEVAVAPASFISGSAGVDVALSSNFNVISLVYVGRTSDGTVTWASDTVVVRVGDTTDDFPAMDKVDVPFSTEATDDAAGNTDQLDIQGLLYYNAFSGIARNRILEPTQDITITHTAGDGDTTDSVDRSNSVLDITSTADEPGEIVVTGNFDTSGFTGGVHYTNFNFSTFAYNGPALVDRTVGFNLVQDATGVKLIDDVTSIQVLTSDSRDDVFSSFSVVSMADYGDWNFALDFFGTVGIDWNGQIGSSALNATAAGTFNNDTIEEAEGWSGGFYGSNDFIAEGFSVNVQSQGVAPETTLFTTSVITESPGFGAALSLMAVAAIAYIAPRFRKD